MTGVSLLRGINGDTGLVTRHRQEMMYAAVRVAERICGNPLLRVPSQVRFESGVRAKVIRTGIASSGVYSGK